MTFSNIQTSVESIFATTEWTQNNISAYPANYQGKITGKEWVRVNTFPNNSDLFFKGERTYGQLVFNIFVPSGQGMIRALEISDLLKGLFERKTISGIQTTNSFITTKGIDEIDKGLFRVDYIVNFNNYTQ